MKNGFLTSFGLFAFSQLLLWFVSMNDNIVAGGEVFMVTIVICLFMGLFFTGYGWARWVATILLGLIGSVIASMTFEGFGFGFLSVAFLYGAVIITLFKRRPGIKSEHYSEPESVSLELKEPLISKPDVEGGFYVGEDVYKYPLLLKRYQSMFIDALLLFSIMVITMVVMGESESRQTIMISLGAIFLLGYEPLLTTYSATLGQHMMGIRVRDVKNPKERINLFRAYIRILVKWFLGWLSFVTINFNPQHRAIHDLAGSSVVIRIK